MYNMKYLNTFLSVCCLLAANIATAQFSVYGTAGISGLKYSPEGGTTSVSSGFGGGAGYSLALGSSWKAGFAAEIATYSSEASFGTLSESYKYGTGENESRVSYSLRDYEEKQNVTALSVPLTIQYQTDNSIGLCISGGLKLGIPVSAQASINPGTVYASGEYEYEGQTYIDLPQHNLPDGLKLSATKSKIDLRYSVAATLEAGALIRKLVYAGAYLDYGLNDMRKYKNRHALEYRSDSSIVHNSILNTDLVGKVNLFSVGLKIKIQF
jgi:hypothetical protein